MPKNLIPTAAALGLLLALPGLAAGGQALPRVSPEDAGLSRAMLERATERLERAVSEMEIAGAVGAVAREGRLAYLEAVGYQDIETRTPMDPASIFRIYSMTKTVTAVAVMMLHEEGAFDLDEPVSRYLPAFSRVGVTSSSEGPARPPSRPITIRDLLLHTSGLSHRTDELYREARVRSRAIPLARFIENIVETPLMEDPGTRYRYGASPTVLGALVEVWSGKGFDEFLEERIFRPLGMSDTGFWVEADRAHRLTTVYRSTADGLRPHRIEEVPFTERPALLEGAVGLVSTVPDYLRFAQMLLNGGELDGVRILEAETVAEMTSNGLPDAILEQLGGATGWGFANVNVVLEDGASPLPASVGEYSRGGSAGTMSWMDPAEDLLIVIMWQNNPSNPGTVRGDFKTLVRESILR